MKTETKVKLTMTAALLIALLGMFGTRAVLADTVIELGPTAVVNASPDTFTVTVGEEWRGKWAARIGLIREADVEFCGTPDCRWSLDDALFVGGERMWRFHEDWSVSVGAYWFEKNRVTTANVNALLSIKYHITPRLGVKYVHISNAGSGSSEKFTNHNAEAVYKDCSRTKPGRKCRRYVAPFSIDTKSNVGYDSLLITWRF